MKAIKILTLLSLIGLLIGACKTETPTNQEVTIDINELQGVWVIDTAKVVGKVRNSLNGGTFNFVNEEEFISGTNLSGTGIEMDVPTTYKVEDEKISIMGNEALVFNIDRLKDDKMVLNAQIRGLECEFIFSREAAID